MTIKFGILSLKNNNYTAISSFKQSDNVEQSGEQSNININNNDITGETAANIIELVNNGESIYKIANDIANGNYSSVKTANSLARENDLSSLEFVVDNNAKYSDLSKTVILAMKELIATIRNRKNTSNGDSAGDINGGTGTDDTNPADETGGKDDTPQTGDVDNTNPTGGGSSTPSSGLENYIGNGYNIIWYNIAKTMYGPDTAGMLDLAHEKRNDTSYEKDAIKMTNWSDTSVSVDNAYLKGKVASEFKDYGFNIDTIPGYFFKSNSEPSKRISEDTDFLAFVKNNKNKILDKTQTLGMAFTTSNNLHYALGHVAVKNSYLDDSGNLHVYVYDTYDFNSSDTSSLSIAGRKMMMAGELKPYFTVHEVVVSKDKLNTLWNS